MRLMSFAMTTPQFIDRTKTVTRRDGWDNIILGAPHMGIEKGRGLKRGEKVKRLHYFIPLSSRWEPLQRLLDDPKYGAEEMVKEGFPGMPPAQFVEMLCRKHKCTPAKEFNRIEFEHF